MLSKKVLLLGSFLLMFLRSPSILLNGRIYAEEGSVYLHYAWAHTAFQTLIDVHQGYYSLFPNVCTLIAARVIPIAAAAVFLAWCSMAIQILAVWLAINCEAIENKLFAVLIVVLAVPANEVWLNTIGSQFYLAVCAGIILISDTSKHRILRSGTLLIAGLTGVVSCFMTPFFIFRALRDRSARFQAWIISSCTVVQFVAVLHGGMRPTNHDFRYVADAFLTKNFIYLFLGRIPAKIISFPHAPFIAFTVVLIFLFTSFCYLRWTKAAWLFAAGIWVEALSLYAAVLGGSVIAQPMAETRYFLIFNVFAGLSLVIASAKYKSKIPLALIACTLFAGATDYALDFRRPAGPVWSKEVAIWMHHPRYSLNTYPSGWSLTLP